MRPTIPNAKPWKKGQSGNPKGRPRKTELDQIIKDILGTETRGVTEAEAIIHAMVKRAKEGDVRAASLIFDRAYGRVKQAVEVTTPPEPFRGFHSLEEAFFADVLPDVERMRKERERARDATCDGL